MSPLNLPAEAEGDLVPVLAPLMRQLEVLAEAGTALAGQGVADAHSDAVKERARAAASRGPDFEDSVFACHSNAGILRFSATDHLRQFAKMFAAVPVPVYAHLCVARACLEASALSYWLSSPEVDPEGRVQKYLLTRLSNANQLERSPIGSVKQSGKDLRTKVRREGTALGWVVIANEKRVSVGGLETPATQHLISDVLSDGDEALDTLGKTMWWFLSGVSHGSAYALLQSIEIANPVASALEPTRVSIFTSSTSVTLQGIVLGRAYRSLMNRHAKLFGWENTAWSSASSDFVDFARGTMARLGPGARVA